jgi:2-desacetyl-2-hydroxyethyl bacteriochlorophyllide A dehydrogenase
MKAARLIGERQLKLMDIDRPVIGGREVLIKVSYAGICGTDYAIYSGESSFIKNGMIRFPLTLGHEWSGIVEEIGSKVQNLKLGDRVVGDAGVSCGVCYECLCGRYIYCKKLRAVGTINAWDGAYAEYILMPERHAYKIPECVSLEEAALVEPAATALYSVKRGEVKPGDVVVIQGTGPIGLSAVQMAKILGASCVILSGRKDFKLDIGRRMGADFTVNIMKENLKDKVMEITGDNGADVIIEASGSVEALKFSLEIIKSGGTISVVAFYENQLSGFDIDNFVFKDVKLVAVSGSPCLSVIVMELMKFKKIDLMPLITHRYRFDEIVSVMDTMKNDTDKKIKIMLRME